MYICPRSDKLSSASSENAKAKMELRKMNFGILLLGFVCALPLTTGQYNPVTAAYSEALAVSGSNSDLATYNAATYPLDKEAYMESAVHVDTPEAAAVDYISNYIIDIAVTLNDPQPENSIPAVNDSLTSLCPPSVCVRCSKSIFPEITGICHNEENPRWGSAFTCQRRGIDEYNWEDGALLTVALQRDDTLLTPLGVDLTGKTNFIFHVQGDTPVRLLFGTSAEKVFSLTLGTEGDPQSSLEVFATNDIDEIPEALVVEGEFRYYWLDWSEADTLVFGEGCECFGTQSLLKVQWTASAEIKENLAVYASAPGLVGQGPQVNQAAQEKTKQIPLLRVPLRQEVTVETNTKPLQLERYQIVADKYKKSFFFHAEGNGIPVLYLRENANSDNPRYEITFDPTDARIAYFDASGKEIPVTVGGVQNFWDGEKDFWVIWAGIDIAIGTGTRVSAETTVAYASGVLADNTYDCSINYFSVTSLNAAVYWTVSLLRYNVPRETSICGTKLPSPRAVSRVVHRPEGNTKWSPVLSLWLFQMGQFFDHDVAGTPIATLHGTPLVCCNGRKPLPEEETNRFCHNIIVPPGDSHFQTGECLTFTRSAACVDCAQGTDKRHRNQINELTSYVDLSQVYGNTEEELEHVRDHVERHLMLVDGTELPQNTEVDPACNPSPDTRRCRFSADLRSSETSLLNSIHTLFVLFHNHIAKQLVLAGNTDDRNLLFYWTRNIAIGIYQNIVFNEYITSYINPALLQEKGILDNDNSCTYDPTKSAAMSVIFGILYRLGHTWIPKIFLENALCNAFPSGCTLPTLFFNPHLSYQSQGTQNLIEYAVTHQCPDTDTEMEDEVLDRLFEVMLGQGSDLGSLNAQRSRDHGLLTYCEIRALFGLYVPKSFQDAVDHNLLSQTVADRFKEVYQHICDVNGFSLAIAEEHVDGKGFVGETLNEVLSESFQRLKCNDRFYYQFEAMGFNDHQKAEIRSVTMAKLICAVMTNITEMTPRAFNAPGITLEDGTKNDLIPCSEILQDGPLIDFDLFTYIPTKSLKGGFYYSPAADPGVAKKELNTATVEEEVQEERRLEDMAKKERRNEVLEELLEVLDKLEKTNN